MGHERLRERDKGGGTPGLQSREVQFGGAHLEEETSRYVSFRCGNVKDGWVESWEKRRRSIRGVGKLNHEVLQRPAKKGGRSPVMGGAPSGQARKTLNGEKRRGKGPARTMLPRSENGS